MDDIERSNVAKFFTYLRMVLRDHLRLECDTFANYFLDKDNIVNDGIFRRYDLSSGFKRTLKGKDTITKNHDNFQIFIGMLSQRLLEHPNGCKDYVTFAASGVYVI